MSRITYKVPLVENQNCDVINEVLSALLGKYYPGDEQHIPKLFYVSRRNKNSGIIRTNLHIGPDRVGNIYWARPRDGSNMMANIQNLGLGGTLETILVQLILWHQGKPHRPLSAMRLWVDRGAGNEKFLQLLEKYGYDTQELCKCVLCGEYPIKDSGLDWWKLGKNSGPVCSMGRCRK